MWNPKEIRTGEYDNDLGYVDCTNCGVRTGDRTIKSVAVKAWNRAMRRETK